MEKPEEDGRPITKQIVEQINYLIARFPNSPNFLGKNIYYPAKKKSLFAKKKIPDLSGIREDIQKISERKGVVVSRDLISKNLKQYPYSADLHAIKAIQVFNDLSQSGISDSKVDALVEPLVRIATALHNGGMSLFNSNWFITIYLKYLEVIRERLSRDYNFGIHHADSDVRAGAENLYQRLLQVPRLLQVRNHLNNLSNLSMKLKGTVFITESTTMNQLKMACHAIAAKNEEKAITPGKTANSILVVTLSLNALFSRIPILKELVKNTLKNIPDITRDLILQKQMIINTGRITDFQLAVAGGDEEKSKELASNLFDSGLKTINYYLENAILSKQFEADPFLKTAWIAKESRNLFESRISKERLKKSAELMRIILGQRCRHAPSIETATQYNNEIHTIMEEQ